MCGEERWGLTGCCTPLSSVKSQWKHREKRAGKTQESSKSPATSDMASEWFGKAAEKQCGCSIEIKYCLFALQLPMAPDARSMTAWTTGCGAMVSKLLSEEVSLSFFYLVKKNKWMTLDLLTPQTYTEHDQSFVSLNPPLTLNMCVFPHRDRGHNRQQQWLFTVSKNGFVWKQNNCHGQ